MPHDNPHRCRDCDILLSKNYPYEYCPRHWRQRFHAPPGEYRFDYFEAAAILSCVHPFFLRLPRKLHTGSTIAASQRSMTMSA